jgi:hypothetical protein
MSQPPYPLQGGDDPGSERPGRQERWHPPGGDDEPTEELHPPPGARGSEGQRDQTRQFGPPPYGQPPYGPPPYGQPGQPPPYGPYGPPGQPWAPPGGPGAPPPKSTNSTLIALVVAGVVLLAAAGVGLWLVVRDVGDSTTAAGSSTSASTDPSSSSSGSSSPSSSQSSSLSSSPSSGRSSSPSSGRGTSAPPTGRAIPPATVPPQGLGNDPQLDQYAQTCHDGDMAACDTLFKQSEAASRYQAYGDSCAGRRPLGTDVSCTVSFPAE